MQRKILTKIVLLNNQYDNLSTNKRDLLFAILMVLFAIGQVLLVVYNIWIPVVLYLIILTTFRLIGLYYGGRIN